MVVEPHKPKSANQLIMVSCSNKESEQEQMSDLSCDSHHLSFSPQEGRYVNTHVTAPGAIVALGLAFLKTNDR